MWFSTIVENLCKSSVRSGRHGMTNGWDQIKRYLESRISTEAYRNWIQKTDYEGQEENRLLVRVPDEVTKQWLEQEYGDQVRTAIHDLSLPIREVRYELGLSQPFTNGTHADPVTFASPITHLNPKF